MTIRFVSSMGEYLLLDPEVGQSSRGPHFTARYRYVDGTGYAWPIQGPGDFRLRDCVLCEPIPEQVEMRLEAA